MTLDLVYFAWVRERIGLPRETVETEAATVAGLALEQLGHIPDPGESFSCGRLDFVVTKVEEQRIQELHVTVRPAPADPEDEID